jgi:hypothetical protein
LKDWIAAILILLIAVSPPILIYAPFIWYARKEGWGIRSIMRIGGVLWLWWFVGLMWLSRPDQRSTLTIPLVILGAITVFVVREIWFFSKDDQP